MTWDNFVWRTTRLTQLKFTPRLPMAISNVTDHIHIPKAWNERGMEQSGERLNMESWEGTTNLVFCSGKNVLPFFEVCKGCL